MRAPRTRTGIKTGIRTGAGPASPMQRLLLCARAKRATTSGRPAGLPQLLAYSENVLRNLATLGPATAMQ